MSASRNVFVLDWPKMYTPKNFQVVYKNDEFYCFKIKNDTGVGGRITVKTAEEAAILAMKWMGTGEAYSNVMQWWETRHNYEPSPTAAQHLERLKALQKERPAR